MKYHQTRIDLPLEVRVAAIEILSQSLANCFDLFSQTKQFHWNLKGRSFISLHKLADELADELLELADSLAERITALGGTAMGTVRAASMRSQLLEFPTEPFNELAYLTALADRTAQFGRGLREAGDKTLSLGDDATSNFYVDAVYANDKRLYFIEAHLQED